jgi:DNA-binding NarL/FixJ family response regulator
LAGGPCPPTDNAARPRSVGQGKPATAGQPMGSTPHLDAPAPAADSRSPPKMGPRPHSAGAFRRTAFDRIRLGGMVIAVAEHGAPVLATERVVSETREQLRLLVVDDHPAVRRGLHELLEDQPDFRVLDAVSSAEEAMSVAEREELDVAVVDYQLGGRSGLWVSRKLKRLPRPPRVLIYSAYCDGLLAASAVVAEADGLVSKGGLGSELCDAIRAVAGGRSLLPMVPAELADVMRRRLDGDEQVIFGMSLARIPPPEIAKTLGISASGLESRQWEMLRKLKAMGADLETSAAGTRSAVG